MFEDRFLELLALEFRGLEICAMGLKFVFFVSVLCLTSIVLIAPVPRVTGGFVSLVGLDAPAPLFRYLVVIFFNALHPGLGTGSLSVAIYLSLLPQEVRSLVW